MTADFYIRMVLAALVILGVWNAFGAGMIFSRVGDWMENNIPTAGKPLGLCPPCMASVWGAAVWFFTGGPWTDVFIFILALSGAMVLITRNLLR